MLKNLIFFSVIVTFSCRPPISSTIEKKTVERTTKIGTEDLLAGNWSTPCSQETGQNKWKIHSIQFYQGAMNESIKYFSDKSCTKPSETTTFSYGYSVKSEKTASLNCKKVSTIVYDTTKANDYNGKTYLGFSDWAVNAEKNISQIVNQINPQNSCTPNPFSCSYQISSNAAGAAPATAPAAAPALALVATTPAAPTTPAASTAPAAGQSQKTMTKCQVGNSQNTPEALRYIRDKEYCCEPLYGERKAFPSPTPCNELKPQCSNKATQAACTTPEEGATQAFCDWNPTLNKCQSKKGIVTAQEANPCPFVL